MSRVRSQDTRPEMIVRSFLHRNGFRFRLHVKNLPGHPDIVLPKYKTIIEVRGCFWHRHPGCKKTTMPSANADFWQKKFAENVERDIHTEHALKSLGWTVLVVWECETKSFGKQTALAAKICDELKPTIWPGHNTLSYPLFSHTNHSKKCNWNKMAGGQYGNKKN